MGTIALIPARGGSKRLPRKNIYELAGKPLVAYSIIAAQQSRIFDRIIVSTEDNEIANIAKEFGAEVISRSHDLAQDHSSVIQVCLDVLRQISGVDQLCCIYATAVLLKPESIVASHQLLNSDQRIDFVMGVSNYTYSPVQALKQTPGGYLDYMWPEWKKIQSQYYPEMMVSNGTLYWARADALVNEETFYGKRMKGFLIPEEQVSDINTFADLLEVKKKIAEMNR